MAKTLVRPDRLFHFLEGCCLLRIYEDDQNPLVRTVLLLDGYGRKGPPTNFELAKLATCLTKQLGLDVKLTSFVLRKYQRFYLLEMTREKGRFAEVGYVPLTNEQLVRYLPQELIEQNQVNT